MWHPKCSGGIQTSTIYQGGFFARLFPFFATLYFKSTTSQRQIFFLFQDIHVTVLFSSYFYFIEKPVSPNSVMLSVIVSDQFYSLKC